MGSTVATAKACLMTMQHCSFVWYEIHRNYLEEPVQGLEEMYARKVLNLEPDFSGSEEVADACRLVVSAIDGVRQRRW